MINKFFHWLSHIFKRNEGKVITWLEGDQIYVGFKCSCGKISDIQQIGCEKIGLSVDKIYESEMKNE
jgi:hypothetical protein